MEAFCCEWFDWFDVDRCIKDDQRQTNYKKVCEKELSRCGDPQAGFNWYWVSSIRFIDGFAGWLEVDVQNQRQGRFFKVI